MSSASVNPLDTLAIQNTIARYCEALDTKLWPLLDKVFLPDATAEYPFHRDLKGVEDIRNKIQNRYITPTPAAKATVSQIKFRVSRSQSSYELQSHRLSRCIFVSIQVRILFPFT